MAAAMSHPAVPDGFVRLSATAPLRADPDRVAEVLSRDEGPWAGGRLAYPEAPDLRRYAVDLRLQVGGHGAGLATFGKAAYLDLGHPRRAAAGWEVEIGWCASSAAPLFPVFSGRLVIRPDELRIDGLYAPPGGVVGRVADRMLLHVAANGTARWLLAEIERAVAP